MSNPVSQFLFRGHPHVDVFFVISGYALSFRMLSYMHSRQSDRLLNSLVSSIFRRYLRLFVPSAFATLVAMLLVYSRIAIKQGDPNVLQSSFGENLLFWMRDTFRASNPFTHVVGWWSPNVFCTAYLMQLWTIPIEFRGSMVLFLFCAATCKMSPMKRMVTTWLCITACLLWEHHYASLFLVGMWIADVRMFRASTQPAPLSISEPPASISLPHEPIAETESAISCPFDDDESKDSMFSASHIVPHLPYIILFLLGINALAAPLTITTKSPLPYNFMAYLLPRDYSAGATIHWPLSIGATLIVYALDNSSLLREPLMTPTAQFLGELSFGIYAMHQTVRWVVWEPVLVPWLTNFWAAGRPDVWVGFWKLLPGYLIMSCLVLWAAEGFRRVDTVIVRLGRKLQDYCFE